MSPALAELTREVLEDLYVHQQISATQIGHRFGCGRSTITQRLHRYGIPIRPQSTIIDLTGQSFGQLTVERRAPNHACGQARWECHCQCGRQITALGSYLRNGHTKSCGCRKIKGRVKDITGQRFYHLTVIQKDVEAGSPLHWICKCDCGNTLSVNAIKLRTAKCRSCGCKRDLAGPASYHWKGGRCRTQQGYVLIWCPGGKHRQEHRVVMENILGRPLRKDENVHHKNGIRDDNRPENLEIWVKHHPCGQRIPDIVAHAEEILKRYAPEKLVVNSVTELDLTG